MNLEKAATDIVLLVALVNDPTDKEIYIGQSITIKYEKGMTLETLQKRYDEEYELCLKIDYENNHRKEKAAEQYFEEHPDEQLAFKLQEKQDKEYYDSVKSIDGETEFLKRLNEIPNEWKMEDKLEYIVLLMIKTRFFRCEDEEEFNAKVIECLHKKGIYETEFYDARYSDLSKEKSCRFARNCINNIFSKAGARGTIGYMNTNMNNNAINWLSMMNNVEHQDIDVCKDRKDIIYPYISIQREYGKTKEHQCRGKVSYSHSTDDIERYIKIINIEKAINRKHSSKR